MIDEQLSSKVVSIGVAYKNNAPGGMASVARTYSQNFFQYNYIHSWEDLNPLKRIIRCLIAMYKVTSMLSTSRSLKIVHIHSAAYGSFYRKTLFLIISKIFKKKAVIHIHASQFKVFYKTSSLKPLIRRILKSYDCIIVLSDSWKYYFEELTNKQAKIIVLNNIIQQQKEIVVSAPPTQPLNLLFLGELGPRKGIFDLISLFSKYRHELRGKVILNIGGNGQSGKCKSLIKSHDLMETIRFNGYLAGHKKHLFLKNCDAFILPSYNEGLPIAILEAMSYGKAVITTNVGGIPDLIKTGENGIVVDPGDQEQLYKAILCFIKNPNHLTQYGKSNLKKVVGFYENNVIDELEKIYKTLLK